MIATCLSVCLDIRFRMLCYELKKEDCSTNDKNVPVNEFANE
jgi:hypothetical protein